MTYKIKPWREKLEHIKELPDNWDDYGSPPLTEEQYNNAKLFLEKIDGLGFPSVQLVPCSGGGVQLEWHCNNKELEVDFTSGKVGYLKVLDADNITDETMEEGEFLITEEDKIFDLMNWLMEGKNDGNSEI
jgi:hypothetical protein